MLNKGVNKIKDFTSHELNKYQDIYTKIMFEVDEIRPFLPEEIIQNRRYVSKLNQLKAYIDKIKEADCKAEKTGILQSDEKYKEELLRFKNSINQDLDKMEKCMNCACLNCINESCQFNSCLGCRQSARVKYCDKERNTLIEFDNWILELTNNDTGSENRYMVLAVVEDLEFEEMYIMLENIKDGSDKLVLKYSTGIKEDTYGEITNPEEFDQIVSFYMNVG